MKKFCNNYHDRDNARRETNTAQKLKFSIKDFFSKCDQIRSFQQIWSHLLKKSLMENSIFLCSVIEATIVSNIIWASELRVSQYKAFKNDRLIKYTLSFATPIKQNIKYWNKDNEKESSGRCPERRLTSLWHHHRKGINYQRGFSIP